MLSALVHLPAYATTYAVGTGPGCTHATLQAAIDAAVADPTIGPRHYIHLTTGTIAVPNGLRLHNALADISITGGHASCTGVQGATSRTVLDASGGADGSVLDIRYFGTAEARNIFLGRLDITGGTGETGIGASSEGAGLELRGNLQVYLEQGSAVRDNRAFRAAGILMQGGPGQVTLYMFNQARIGGNIADNDGGGIWCTGMGRVVMQGASVDFNQAGRDGGGIWLGDRCSLRVAPGEGLNIFSNNTAGGPTQLGRGGALFYQSGSAAAGPDVDVQGSAISPVFMVGNSANGPAAENAIGGALYLEGNGANQRSVQLRDVVLANNSATATGSAIAVVRAIDLSISGSPARCDGLFGLCSAISGGIGSAIRINDAESTIPGQAPRVRISRTRFTGNTGAALIESATLYNANAELVVDSSVFDGNDVDGIVFAADSFDLTYSTIFGNTNGQFVAGLYASAGQTNIVNLSGSLIWQPGVPVFVSSGAGIEAATHNGCLLAHDATGISNPGAVRTANPLLDAAFVPAATSPALDVCNVFFAMPAQDAYGTPRPTDQPGVPNALGSHDLGAIERPLLNLIFANSFE
jgi:hypothetical protein